MTPSFTTEIAKAEAQVAELRKRYGELVAAAAPENTPTGLAELTASNKELSAAVGEFRKDLEASLIALPSGAKILVGEYAALGELARLNEVNLEHVLAGVKEVSGGRVRGLDLTERGLTDVSPLSHLTGLTRLGLHGNPLSGASSKIISSLRDKGVDVLL